MTTLRSAAAPTAGGTAGAPSPLQALLLLAHPRGNSLTAQIADRAFRRMQAAGVTVDVLNLHAEGFDPRMGTADEPDWNDRDREYSAEVRAHMQRIDAADAIVVVFPIWWFGLPAILKGWVDRVWNYGFAYGRSSPRLAGKRILWVGLAGYSEELFVNGGWDELMDRQLRVGISEFSGIEDATVRLIYGTVPDRADHEARSAHLRTVLTSADTALNEFLGLPSGFAPVPA